MAVASSITVKRVGLLLLVFGMTNSTSFSDSIPEYTEDQMLTSPRPQYDNSAIGRSLAGSPESWTVAVHFDGEVSSRVFKPALLLGERRLVDV